MNSIRTHRYMRRLSLSLAAVMVLSVMPFGLGAAFAQAENKSVLVFPFIDASSSQMSDLGRLAATSLTLAICDVSGFQAVQYSTTSASIRRAVSEGRLRQIDVEDQDRDLAASLIIGNVLDFDYIVLGNVQSLTEKTDPAAVDVMLTGQVYEVSACLDPGTGEPVANPQAARAFAATGASLSRDRYTGSNRVLVREALDDATAKAAQSLAGRAPESVTAKHAKKSSSTHKWVLMALLVAGLALVANNSSDSGNGGNSPNAYPPRNLVLEDQDGVLRLTWDEPTGTTLTLLRYEIYRAVDGGAFGRVDAGNLVAGTSFFNDYSTLIGTHVYQYRIRAMYTSGDASTYVISGAVNVTK